MSTRSAASYQDSNGSAATMSQPTIQQPPAGKCKTKELRSHLCITIKWSRRSASRRRRCAGFALRAGAGRGPAGVCGGAPC